MITASFQEPAGIMSPWNQLGCSDLMQRHEDMSTGDTSAISCFFFGFVAASVPPLPLPLPGRLLGYRPSAAKKGFFEDIDEPTATGKVDGENAGNGATHSSQGSGGNGASASHEDSLTVSDEAAERSK